VCTRRALGEIPSFTEKGPVTEKVPEATSAILAKHQSNDTVTLLFDGVPYRMNELSDAADDTLAFRRAIGTGH
jgi:hypothetical protein